ncbi:MAG: SdrD B-like domain-containing protein, partial [Desulfobulbaceae bacterium]|nr:SdrD B-like domain-containing protein [Desulfobulbaceae bacterium]
VTGQDFGNKQIPASVCTDFEDGTPGGWQVNNTLSTIILDGTNHYVETTDLSGASSFFNATDNAGNWGSSLLVNGCGSLCWDVNYLFAGTGNDGSSQPITVTPSIAIFGVNGLSATFVTNNLITAGDGWHSYCAPLMYLNTGDPLPSNANGHWVMAAGTTYADWNDILNNVARVQFGVDPTSYQSERFGFDNICIKNTGDCVPLSSICGMKFNDINGDGLMNGNETGLSGWTISLTYNQATGPVTVNTTTDADGKYCFNSLTAGSYTVSETQQSGWSQTFPASPETHSITLTAGLNVLGKDFGNQQLLGSICGTKFNDINGDGIQNNGESGLQGWTISLTDGDAAEPVTLTTFTGEDGIYCFNDLAAGSYKIKEV